MTWWQRIFGKNPSVATTPDHLEPTAGHVRPDTNERRHGTPLPQFRFYPNPMADGAIVKQEAVCDCCGFATDYVCPSGIYCRDPEPENLCPWCVADGSAARVFDGSFQDIFLAADYDLPANGAVAASVPQALIDEVHLRTPGYESWQGNRWLFTDTSPMTFIGEVVGKALLSEGNDAKITAACDALGDWQYSRDAALGLLPKVVRGGQPAIYLFKDPDSETYAAYADMT